MRLENIKSNNNFGWNSKIHARLTRAALDHVPALSKYTKELELASAYPESAFSLGNIIGKTHCYYGQMTSNSASPSKHSLDIYKRKLEDSLVDWEFDDEIGAMKCIGEALHVLQDTADPTHTIKGINPFFKLPAYYRYKNATLNTNIPFIMNGKPANAVTDNFYDLFSNTYNASSNSLNPLDKKNFEMLHIIVRKNLTEAACATVAFLKRLGNLHTMSDNNKYAAIFTELSNSPFMNKVSKS